MSKGIAGFVRDNLEAFAVAIAMALVIRHFCLEAFRIPTKSMKPTLLGDAPPRGGDRILVDKFVYMWRDPQRFEVVVFQFPLNRSRNYIKRLVGLPGEWLRVVDGDIWTSRDEGETWTIQRKPDGVQEQLFFPYYPVPRGESAKARFPASGNWGAAPEWVVSERDRRFKVDAKTEAAKLRFDRKVLAYGDTDNSVPKPGTVSQPGKPWVGDVRLSFDIEVERAGTLVLLLQEHARPHRLVLGPDKGDSKAIIVTKQGETEYPIDFTLASGEDYEISFANVDDRLIVEIDGDRVLEQDFPGPPEQPLEVKFDTEDESPVWKHEISVEATRLKATLSDVTIERDMYYDAENREPSRIWEIPEDSYFMLGDNTRDSYDSRRWRRAEAKFKDGTVIRWQEPTESNEPNYNPMATEMVPGRDEEFVITVDFDGLTRRFNSKDLAEEPLNNLPNPFVPRDHLVGRAFSIFWPIHIPRLVSGPTRVNLIR